MRVLALNCGSSSLKAAVLDSVRNERLFDCHVQKIEADAVAALKPVLDGVGQRAISPEAVAHRIVHGGERFLRATRIDAAVLAEIEALQGLAPLHNPPAVAALRAAYTAYPDVPHIAVFDTAFHATLPRRAREYALPADLRTRFGIRRFGFHGISHSHVMECVAAYMRAAATTLRVISCHLGNGASVAALEYGRSIETSMGMTPLEGLVMGTRAGDIDPGALLHLLRSGELDVQQLDEVLNERSGLMGLAGTNDMSEVERRAAEGDEACRLAIALYSHRVRKYIGAYAAVMGGVDAIAFTGGVGENSALIRHRCLTRLEFLGAVLDEDKNREIRVDDRNPCGEISVDRGRTRLFVVRADEELVMAREAAALLARARAPVGKKLPIAVSARHAHLTQRTIDSLFGAGYPLTRRTALKQPGQFAAQETVALIGPRGRIDEVRMMGPPRDRDQVEISRSDEFVLGVDAPVRTSGDLSDTPGITLEGPAGRCTIPSGLICARRHIHMSPEDARRLGVRDGDTVAVRIDSADRDLTFDDVAVRVAPQYALELHLDTDEANAAGAKAGDYAELLLQ